MAFEGFISTANSSTTPLAGSAAFTGVYELVKDFASITVTSLADVPPGLGLVVEFSSNGTDTDGEISVPIVATSNYVGAASLPVLADYARVKYTNGGAPQTTFRLRTTYSYAREPSTIHVQGPVGGGAQLFSGSINPIIIGGLNGASIPVGISVENWGAARVMPDNRYAVNNYKYMVSIPLTGSTVIGTNLGSIGVGDGFNPIAIQKITVILAHSAAGLGNPIRFIRASVLPSGGTQMTVADIPRKNTDTPNPNAEVRLGAVTGTKAAQPLLYLGGNTVTTTNQAGSMYVWEARSSDDFILVGGNSGLFIDQHPMAGDADDRYIVTIEWEENF